MVKKHKHRGRLQAQGGGLEASETWEQEKPLSRKDGLSLLSKLKGKLSARERALRKRPFEEAERFIEQAQGVDAPLRKTFRNRKTRDVRVDIEVWGDTAFVSFILIWKFL
jgi:hypothetical protein